jgi:hypothetical protein
MKCMSDCRWTSGDATRPDDWVGTCLTAAPRPLRHHIGLITRYPRALTSPSTHGLLCVIFKCVHVKRFAGAACIPLLFVVSAVGECILDSLAGLARVSDLPPGPSVAGQVGACSLHTRFSLRLTFDYHLAS